MATVTKDGFCFHQGAGVFFFQGETRGNLRFALKKIITFDLLTLGLIHNGIYWKISVENLFDSKAVVPQQRGILFDKS